MTVTYRDTGLKIFGSFIIAHFIEMVGQEESVWEMLLKPSYYIEVGSGFVIAFVIWEYVSRVTKLLDRKYDWVDKPVIRTILQVSLAIVVTAFLTYLLVSLQFKFIFGKNILDGHWLLYEFPIAIIFIVMINVLYVAYYFFERWRYSESLLKIQPVSEQSTKASDVVVGSASAEARPAQRHMLVARKGTKVFPLNDEDVALIYKDSTLNYAKTFKDEVFIVDDSLEEVERHLKEDVFFRANRQTIVNFKSIESYAPIENGKLKVALKLPFPQPIIISQKRAPDFRIWIKRG